MFRLVLVSLACLAVSASAQTNARLSGTVRAADTREGLAGTVTARALLPDGRAGAALRGVAADSSGRFTLALPPGRWAVAAQHPGFETARDTLRVQGPATWHAALAPTALGEVTVAATRQPASRARGGVTRLEGRDIRALPALLGEPDVIKAVQLLPGVRGGAEGSAGLYVRGGSPDQTLTLLDGTPVYNPTHLFGFVSTFNAATVGAATLERGPTPARWGGRLGSVLDVRTRDADGTHLDGQIGMLAAALSAEVPVGERGGLLVAARRSTVDLLAQPFLDRAADRAAKRGEARIVPRASFGDVTLHAHRQGARDRLDVTAFVGQDDFTFSSVDPNEADGTTDLTGGSLDWGNRLASVRWARVFSPAVSSEVQASVSDYGVEVGLEQSLGEGGDAPERAEALYRSGIRTAEAGADLSVLAGRHALRLGARLAARRFSPGALSIAGADNSVAVDTAFGDRRTDAIDASLYAEDAVRLGRWTLGLGLRAGLYATDAHRYPSVEPRLHVALRLPARITARAALARTQQPLHLLTTGAGIGLPADLWVPADAVGPETAWEASAGLAGAVGGRTTWSLDAYSRRLDGLVAYREGASFATPFEDWRDLVVQGEGRARGLEVLVRHRGPRLTGWLAYTLASTERRFDALNGGAWFPYRYDRRHDVSAAAVLRVGRVDLSAVAVYATGDAITLPSAEYDAPRYSPSFGGWLSNPLSADVSTAYDDRNGYRLPPSMRLDLGATLFFRRGAHPHALSLTVYNATNHKTPFLTTLETRADPAGGTRRQLVGVGVAPILPTLTYRFGL